MLKSLQKVTHRNLLLFFALLTLILSWPLPVRMMGWAPGVAQWAFDESTFIWNIWYFKHSLIDNLSNPLHSEIIYYPLGIDLVLYTYNIFNALIAQPLHVGISLLFASNATVLFSTALSGYGTYLLTLWLLNRHTGVSIPNTPISNIPISNIQLAALAAGLLYAFASNRAIYNTLGHYDMSTTQWIPFYALTLLQSLDRSRSGVARRRSALLAGVFFAFNGLAEMITAVFLAIFTIITVLVQLGKAGNESLDAPRTTHHASRTTALRLIVSALSIIGIISFTLWSPVLIPVLYQFLTDDFALKGWGEAIPLSADLLSWFTPTVIHPFFGGDLVDELRRVQLRALEMGVTGFRDINTVFIGWITGILALTGLWVYRRKLQIWGWTALMFGLFTLGPFLQINGRYRFDLDGVETSFPLPYALLHYIPIIKANRAPNRNSVLLMLAVAVLLAFAIYWLMERLKHKELRIGAGMTRSVSTLLYSSLIILVLVEHLAVPLPLSDHRVPAVYEQIAADPAPVSVMHAPLGWRNSFGVFGPERTILQYYQTTHQKPMIGGNISRAPDFKKGYFERIPLFHAMTEVQFGRPVDEETLALAAASADELMYLYNVGYALLMPPIERRYPYADTWQTAWDYYKATLPLEPAPFWTGDGIEAYRVIQPPGTDSFALSLGEPGTFPYQAEGWDEAEVDAPYGLPGVWATDRESCLFLPLRDVDESATYAFTAQIRPFDYPGSPAQAAALSVNGHGLGQVELVNDWQDQVWSVPGAHLRDTINEVCFTWAYAASPRQVLGGSRQIGATGVELPMDAEIKAFADGAFIALFDEEGVQSDGSAGRRGVNVTVFDPRRGEVAEMRGFDTAANEFESQSLADFMAGIPQGAPVLVASFGDAWDFLTEGAVDEFRGIGAGVDLDELQGNYFAFAGVKGADPGSAAWVVDPVDAFLPLTLNRDRRTLAAAVGEVEIRQE